MEYIISAIYFIATVFLSAYGFNSIVLVFLYLRVRDREVEAGTPEGYPRVTVQLPLYNERWVVRRLIDAVAALDYPCHLLEIQVLDDSTDSTTAIARETASKWRRLGLDVRVIHRQNRQGFKAGALENGLRRARGEFVAIFDADFVPPPDWLKKVVPHFLANPRLGFVQTRWGHLNGSYSSITRAQVLALDGHFLVEQVARHRGGLLPNFNGSGGMWRRHCIEEAGGWSDRTLCEDLDLSYRAQLAGWRCLYLPEVIAPAEIPPLVSAFKRQQRRWATGSVQCLRHLARPLLSSTFGLWQKIEWLIHLGGYICHPLMVLLLLLSLPVLVLDGGLRFHLTFLCLASLGPPLLYVTSQAIQGAAGWRRLRYLPHLVLLGTGIAVSSTVAVIRGLLRDGGTFQRTPKFSLLDDSGRERERRYALSSGDATILVELALSLYAFAGIALAWYLDKAYAIPLLTLYALSFGYVGLLGLREKRAARAMGKRLASVRSKTVERPSTM